MQIITTKEKFNQLKLYLDGSIFWREENGLIKIKTAPINNKTIIKILETIRSNEL